MALEPCWYPDQGTGTAGVVAREVSVACAGGSEVRLELGPYLIHDLGRCEVGNDHTPVFVEHFRNVSRRDTRADSPYCNWQENRTNCLYLRCHDAYSTQNCCKLIPNSYLTSDHDPYTPAAFVFLVSRTDTRAIR
jgi:hypothetical protein